MRFAHQRRTLLFTLALCLVVSASAPMPGVVAASDPSAPDLRIAHALRWPHAADRVIVGLDAAAGTAGRWRPPAVLARASRRISPTTSDERVVKLAPGRTVAEAMATLSADPGVAYVEPDYLVQAAAADDPAYLDGSLWGMYGSDTAPFRNEFGSGAGAAWSAGAVGDRAIHVGIVDEGIKLDHPDLAANIWTNPYEVANGLDDDGNGYVDDIHGWDFNHHDASVFDGEVDDHGTHVAGTVGALGGNGLGVAGVSWRVTLVPAKFLGARGGYISDAVRALDYLTDLRTRHGVELVASNNSWSGGGYSQALVDAIKRGGDAGILFVAAAGNKGADLDASPVYPAAYSCTTRADGARRGWDCVISVASIAADGTLAPDSDRGVEAVDLGAPGVGILSTHPQDDGYAPLSGTSMATAHVTGAVALCASLDRSRSARALGALLVDTTRATASLAATTASGGRLDVDALAQACTPPPDPTPTPAPTPSAPPTPETIFVDDRDPAFKRGGPGWLEIDHGWAGHHYLLPTRADTRISYGAWRPDLPVAGTYRIVAYVPDDPDLSHAARYRVRTADGWVTRTRNQDKRRGGWVGLGVHALTTTPSVRLGDLTGEPASAQRRLAFDVIRFVPLDEPPAER